MSTTTFKWCDFTTTTTLCLLGEWSGWGLWRASCLTKWWPPFNVIGVFRKQSRHGIQYQIYSSWFKHMSLAQKGMWRFALSVNHSRSCLNTCFALPDRQVPRLQASQQRQLWLRRQEPWGRPCLFWLHHLGRLQLFLPQHLLFLAGPQSVSEGQAGGELVTTVFSKYYISMV